MRLRTQAAVVGLVGLGWVLGTVAHVRPAVPDRGHVERMSLAALESLVARSPDDVMANRALMGRYLDLGMPRLAVDTGRRSGPHAQRDGRVRLLLARAQERVGDVQAAAALAASALDHCTQLAEEIAEASGCDTRTRMELALESTALDRMIDWNVTPVSDPARAALAHELALRPGHISLGP